MRKTITTCALIFLLLSLVIHGVPMDVAWAYTTAGKVTKEDYLSKSAALKAEGQLQQALLALRVAAVLDPKDKRLPKEIKALEADIAETANAYYRKGVSYYNKGDASAARQAFLVAVRIDPDHKKARHYLKMLMNRTDQMVYIVKPGDALIKIAKSAYNDATKAYIIAYFNGLDPQRPLYVGDMLLLPKLAPSQILPRRDIETLVQAAESALARQQYKRVLAISDKIESLSPGHAQVVRLNDAAYFGEGMALMDKQAYLEALERFKQVSANYKGRNQAIAQAREKIIKQAGKEKLHLAESAFKKGDYPATINICDEILAQEPANQKARTLFNAAHYALGKQYIEEGKMAKAIDTLKVLDINYQDTAQLLTQAQAKLNARAEALYRKGVRHFLNEELEAAIDAWEKTLALNPDHPKAKQDIENAMRLLDKWRGLGESEKNADK